MKLSKIAAVAIMSVVAAVSAFAQEDLGVNLDYQKAFSIWMTGTNQKLNDNQTMWFIKNDYYDTWEKYHADEFEWDDQKATLVKQVNDDLAKNGVFKDTKFYAVTRAEFGEYDFTKEGYTVSIEDGVYFTLYRPSHYGERSTEENSLPSGMALWLQDLSKYNFMAMPKADAKKFLQNRKKYDGSINRSILLVIHYTIADFSGKDYTAVKAKFAKSRETPILGIISNIEVYDENNNKIGDLTKK